MDRIELEKILEVIEETKSSISDTSKRNEESAKEYYSSLEFSKGPIKPIPLEPQIEEEEISDYIDYTGDNIPVIAGIDASRTKTYNIGTTSLICISNCRFSVDSLKQNKEIEEINDKKIISVVIYTKDEIKNEKVNKIEEKYSDRNTRMLIRVVNKIKPESQTKQYLKRTTLLLSESSGLSYITDKLDDSIIFLDGPIYPLSITRNSMFDDCLYQNEEKWKGLLNEIMENYRSSYTKSLDKTCPIIGIVKNIDSRMLINTIEDIAGEMNEKDNIIWPDDNSFVSDLLHTSNLTIIKHTSWFEEVQSKNYPQQANIIFKSNQREYSLDKYKTYFFYIRLPKKGTISRVETLNGIVPDSESRELIKKRVLSEISRTKDVPESILESDNKARIKRQQQNLIKRAVRDTTQRYNEERF